MKPKIKHHLAMFLDFYSLFDVLSRPKLQKCFLYLCGRDCSDFKRDVKVIQKSNYDYFFIENEELFRIIAIVIMLNKNEGDCLISNILAGKNPKFDRDTIIRKLNYDILEKAYRGLLKLAEN